MRTKVVTVATRPDPGLDQLVFSMEKQGIDFTVLGLCTQWRGFGTKIIQLQEYLETIKEEYSHVIFVDAFDVAFLGNMAEIESVYNTNWQHFIVFSAEVNCWPNSNLTSQYPECDSQWRYLNSGSYMGPIDLLLATLRTFPPEFRMDDQLYFTNIFLGGITGPIVLDTSCKLFQTTAFCYGEEFSFTTNGRLRNNYHDSWPAIVHGNGRTPMEKVYELLKYEHASS